MSELLEPLSDVSAVRPEEAQFRASGAQAPSFTELVYAHHDWWKSRQNGTPDPAAAAAYDAALAAFQARHGQIIRAYWCSNIESAVVLTERKRFGRSPLFGFHRESDWATKNAPDVASELHRCDALAVRAKAVLTGVRQRICLELVVSSASNLLSLVDSRAHPGDKTKTAAALERDHAEISRIEAYYRDAANGQAQLVYFGGIATVTIAIGGLAAIWLSNSWAAPIAALVAGALGAVVSVVQRINSGKFELDYDVGGPYMFFLGGLRPLIGGVFAMAITFAFSGGLLHVPVAAGESSDHRRLALLVLGFLAGFSERWAQDTLTSVIPAAKGSQPPSTSPGEPRPAGPGVSENGASAPPADGS